MAKNIVITGANRGIGLAFTQHYLAKGDNVYALCRQASEGLEKSGATIVAGIDVTDSESLAKAKEALFSVKIDLLINNAGILHAEALGALNYAEMLQQFEVNALGPLKVTEALQDLISEGGKVALITSRMGSVADNGSGGYYGYRMSKAALNAGGKSLAIDLQPKNIAVAILHPGFVQTEMVGNAGDISASTAAERLAQRIEALTIETTGTFWHSNGEVLPW
ncbi:MAG: SDR family oxidoreductase [Agarilytica sp.]